MATTRLGSSALVLSPTGRERVIVATDAPPAPDGNMPLSVLTDYLADAVAPQIGQSVQQVQEAASEATQASEAAQQAAGRASADALATADDRTATQADRAAAETAASVAQQIAVGDFIGDDAPPAPGLVYSTEMLAGAQGAHAVGFSRNSQGSALRTSSEKFVETVSIDDFSGTDTQKLEAATQDLVSQGGGALRFPARDYAMPYSRPPGGVKWVMDGPNISRSLIGGTEGPMYQGVVHGFLDGPHPDNQLHLQHFKATARGSGGIGSPKADHALSVAVEKEFWSGRQGTPQAGEIDGISIMYRQGGPGLGEALGGISSGAAILADVGATSEAGASQFFEGVNSIIDRVDGTTLLKQMGLQLGMQNTRDSEYYGAVFYTVKGPQNAAIRIQGNTQSPWTRILENIKNGRTNFAISDEGGFRWQGSDQRIFRVLIDDANSDLIFQSSTGVELMRVAQSGRVGFRRPHITKSGVAETLAPDELGSVVIMANTAPATLQLPASLPVGWWCRVIQREPSVVTFQAASGSTIRSLQSRVTSGGRYAVVELTVGANGDGASAAWYLSGDLA